MLRNIMFLMFFFISFQAAAELNVTDPSEACNLLASSGLKGRKWVDYGDGTSGCASDYKDIGSGSPLANNLAFYAMGAGQKVQKVKLVLNANQPYLIKPAIKQLMQASSILAQKLSGATLPDGLKKSIGSGAPMKVVVGAGEVEVVKDVWPSGRGYEIQVIFR